MSNNSDEDDDYFEDDDVDDYYNNDDDVIDSDVEEQRGGNGLPTSNEYIRKRIQELEHFDYECFTHKQALEKLLKDVKETASVLNLPPSLARLILQANNWQVTGIIARASVASNLNKMLVNSGVLYIMTDKEKKRSSPKSKHVCGVCLENFRIANLSSLSCKHLFCHNCWKDHIKYCISEGLSSGIQCMESSCTLLCAEDFVQPFLSNKIYRSNESLASLYQKYLYQQAVASHYQMRFCPGIDCTSVFYAETPKARRVFCTSCKTSCCFECGAPYHVPTDCDTIKKWLTKCADDSETANYISANTKDCPACHICIEKNGGCNHIRCTKCNHDFCWVCLMDWKKHGDQYYECSRYKENPNLATENHQTKAREALKKYLFYFHRWENHSQSLRLEKEARAKIQAQIEEKVNKNDGTWIDWQYLLRAGELLAKCRYTLHYTYPLAYYAETGPEKTLFEYQQAQLEKEIEDLAWQLEHAGKYQRGEVENQMDICQKRTHTLLARFVQD